MTPITAAEYTAEEREREDTFFTEYARRRFGEDYTHLPRLEIDRYRNERGNKVTFLMHPWLEKEIAMVEHIDGGIRGTVAHYTENTRRPHRWRTPFDEMPRAVSQG